jgi:hypothetical protein
MNENWKAIDGYPGYRLSDHGRVLSKRFGREMKYGTCKGYRNVALTQNGKTKTFTVHRLVALHFIGPATGPFIRHLDGDITNIHFLNLAWGTAKENSADREQHGRTARGIKLKHCRTESEVLEIKRLANTGLGAAAIGRIVGLNRSRVHEIMKGKAWRHVTL